MFSEVVIVRVQKEKVIFGGFSVTSWLISSL